MHQQIEGQVSGTARSCDPAPGEGESGFWEAPSATAHLLGHGSSSIQVWCCGIPSSAAPATVLRSKDRLRPVCAIHLPAAPVQYVFHGQIHFIIMFSEVMFMMFVLSSMLESYMLGLILVMLNLVRNLNL